MLLFDIVALREKEHKQLERRAFFRIKYYKVIRENFKAVEEHPQWIVATSRNLETFTPLIPLKLYFWKLFALNEQSN